MYKMYNILMGSYIYIYMIYMTYERSQKRNSPFGSELSLNVGLGAMALSRKPSLGARPSGPSCIHIVPPVPMMRTRDSGRPALTGGRSVTAAGDMCMAGGLRDSNGEET
jgi:hypothetical protein